MFEIGDVVRMKCGGRKMVVTQKIDIRRVEVMWMSKTCVVKSNVEITSIESDVSNGSLFLLLEKMMKTLADLKAQVEEAATVEQSIITLLAGLSQKIKDAGTDQSMLDAISADLDNEKQNMLDAIKANTPSDPNPPSPTPTPTPAPIQDPNSTIAP